MHKRKLVILAGKGISTNVLYNSLKDDYYIEKIILEEPVPRKEFIKKRIKKLGLWNVIGQVLFQFLIVKYLNLISAKRKKDILQNYHLNDAPLPSEKIINLKSVNDNQCLLLLQKIKPELVIVNGTRIISKEILNSISVKFINIHAGITPKYRNVHGAYWALVNNDAENCGVTVHLVDPGIDTGNIIYQQGITITNKDNFVTYPFLQLAEGIIFLKKALHDIFSENLIIKEGAAESKIWHHPTLWEYLYNRVFYNKK
jgi:folate-dependent phosphoribosylglycinamide formyltransferase PurN